MKKLFTNLLLIALITSGLTSMAQISTTKTPNSVQNSTVGTSTYSWTISSAVADCNLGSSFLFAYSKGLALTNFSFSIPSNATILGITSNITYSATSSSTAIVQPRDTTVKLIIAGVESGSNQATGTTVSGTLTSPANGNYKIYGSPTSIWGVSAITPADINSAEFGVAIYMCRYPYKPTISAVILDNSLSLSPNPTPSVTVYYSVPSTGIIESQSSVANLYIYNKTLFLKNAIAQNGEVFVYNLLGEKVYHSMLETSQNSINLGELPAGVYVYKLKVGNKETTQKIKLD